MPPNTREVRTSDLSDHGGHLSDNGCYLSDHGGQGVGAKDAPGNNEEE